MGQLGMMELMAIFVVALLVFGPRKLPELGRSLGKGMREFRRATNDLKASWEDQVRDIDREVSQAAREVRNAGRDIEKDLQNSIKDDRPSSKVDSGNAPAGAPSKTPPTDDSKTGNAPADPPK